ncbi:uncharacterized protein LOC132994325 [Labrus mixtus]|uniref:uncharacterized protein LOC132994325 n=1 Tax=Labrus mixtus TaxID=508554 RepID=UPI0029BFC948|nr:uncharacterized protein LOC132994325 [Labrus mixtus]
MEEEKGETAVTSSAGSEACSSEQTAESSQVGKINLDRKDPLFNTALQECLKYLDKYREMHLTSTQLKAMSLKEVRISERQLVQLLPVSSQEPTKKMLSELRKNEDYSGFNTVPPIQGMSGGLFPDYNRTPTYQCHGLHLPVETSHPCNISLPDCGSSSTLFRWSSSPWLRHWNTVADDSLPTEQEQLNKDKSESLQPNEESQTSMSDRHATKDEKILGHNKQSQQSTESGSSLVFGRSQCVEKSNQQTPYFPSPYNRFILPSHYLSHYLSCPQRTPDIFQGPINEEEQKEENRSISDPFSLFEQPQISSDDVSLPHDHSHETSDQFVCKSVFPMIPPKKLGKRRFSSKPVGDHHTLEETRTRRSDSDQWPLSTLVPPIDYCFFTSLNMEAQTLDLQQSSDTEEIGAQDLLDCLSFQSEHKSGRDNAAQEELDAAVTAVSCSVPNTQPARSPIQICSSGPVFRAYGSLPRSYSLPSLSHMTSADNTLTRSCSLPELWLKASCEQFTPDISDDEDDETYRFQCSCPGLYQCSVTGLVFHMEREGDVVYRTVPWNRKLLSNHHKQPAGPLFDIKCEQQSVCQLHLPHCQIRSSGRPQFLSVAHVNEEGIEFIVPHNITETHVIINISGFSGFGIVKEEDSPPDPVRALVLLFYRPPANPDPSSLLKVLLLPTNVVLRDVLRTRKKLVGDESYIETSPHCKLHPQQDYTLSTCPEDDTVLVEPTAAEFECHNYDNYFPSFQVNLEQIMKHITLVLRHTTDSCSVWKRQVFLWSSGVNGSCGPSTLKQPAKQRLLAIRCSFIAGVSAPVLKSLLDKLFEETVMTDSERESTDEMPNTSDKARSVIDTVRKKGDAASSKMIKALCDLDPFLCKHLRLI